MGWFKRGESRRGTASTAGTAGNAAGSLLPADALDLLAEYGRYRYDATCYAAGPTRLTVDEPRFYRTFSDPHDREPQRFLAELRRLVGHRNDWATVGASRLLQEELDADTDNPDYLDLADATLVFFFNRGDDEFARLTGYERQHWARRETIIVARAQSHHERTT